ncbi:MAG: hypothetical protein ACKVRO_08435 [Micropepsaceae bacterium]
MNPGIDQLLAAVSLAALLIARHGLASLSTRSAVAARLRQLYAIVAALFALRLFAFYFGSSLVVVLTMIVAAWLPFVGLRLTEDLVRRHAPRLVKIGVLAGGIAFTVIAVTLGLVWSAQALLGLALFQALALATMVVHLMRHRSDIAPSERSTADTFLLLLVVTIPLALSDFQQLAPGLPVRGGAFAALLFALTTTRLAWGEGTRLGLAADILVILAAALIGGFAGTTMLSIPATAAIQLGALCGTLAALALIVERGLREPARQSGIVAAVAALPGSADTSAILAAHPLLAGSRILGPVELAGYPPESLSRLRQFRVIREGLGDSDVRDAAADILAATASTHLVRLGAEPPSFLAVAAGGLAGAALDNELDLIARLLEKRL